MVSLSTLHCLVNNFSHIGKFISVVKNRKYLYLKNYGRKIVEMHITYVN